MIEMWAKEGQHGKVSRAGDLKKGTSAAEVPGVQEESHVHGEEVQEDHGAGGGAEATAGAVQQEVGGVMRQGDPQVQDLFAKFVEISLRAIYLSTWQAPIKTFPSGDD